MYKIIFSFLVSMLCYAFKIGTYMIEKKDMQNSENYPIWRMEENNLMKKFELKTDAGRIKHVATGTVSMIVFIFTDTQVIFTCQLSN